MKFKEIPLATLRAQLPKCKRQVQLKQYRLAATYYGKIVGFLVPLSDLNLSNQGEWIQESRTLQLPLTEFRSQLTTFWERLHLDLDCVYLTFHTRRVAAFVSPQLSHYLPIPKADVEQRFLLNDEED